jgi:Tfp pilus assembly protein PilF
MDRITQIQGLLKEEPEDNFLQHALALEYIKIGNDADAKRLFERILNREPGYVGSYYHLGKLLERMGETQQAIQIYKKGMEIAKSASDTHAFNELQAACEDLED